MKTVEHPKLTLKSILGTVFGINVELSVTGFCSDQKFVKIYKKMGTLIKNIRTLSLRLFYRGY